MKMKMKEKSDAAEQPRQSRGAVPEPAPEVEQTTEELIESCVSRAFGASRVFGSAELGSGKLGAGCTEGRPSGGRAVSLEVHHRLLRISKVFISRRRIETLMHQRSHELSGRQLELFGKWREIPWFYALIEVSGRRELEDGTVVLEAEPVGLPPAGFSSRCEWETLPLVSPTVDRLQWCGIKLFITLLVPFGEVFYTYGPPLPLGGVSIADMRYFVDIVAESRIRRKRPPHLLGIRNRPQKISDIIGAHPQPFFELLPYAYSQARGGPTGSRLRKCVSMAELTPTLPVQSEEAWREAIFRSGNRLFAAAFEEQAAVLYIGNGSPLFDSMLYISFRSLHAFLFSITFDAYRRGRDAVAAFCSFPEPPQVYVSARIVSAACKILSCRDEFSELQDYFEDAVEGMFEDEEWAAADADEFYGSFYG